MGQEPPGRTFEDYSRGTEARARGYLLLPGSAQGAPPSVVSWGKPLSQSCHHPAQRRPGGSPVEVPLGEGRPGDCDRDVRPAPQTSLCAAVAPSPCPRGGRMGAGSERRPRS